MHLVFFSPVANCPSGSKNNSNFTLQWLQKVVIGVHYQRDRNLDRKGGQGEHKSGRKRKKSIPRNVSLLPIEPKATSLSVSVSFGWPFSVTVV